MIGRSLRQCNSFDRAHLANNQAKLIPMDKSELLKDYESRWGRIEEAMGRAGIQSQRGLARKLGIEGPSVNGWATGKHLPSMEYIIMLADWSGMCPEYIWMGRGPRIPAEAMDPDADRMIGLLDGMSEERREEALRYVEFLALD